jgi:hypothetical protein
MAAIAGPRTAVASASASTRIYVHIYPVLTPHHTNKNTNTYLAYPPFNFPVPRPWPEKV